MVAVGLILQLFIAGEAATGRMLFTRSNKRFTLPPHATHIIALLKSLRRRPAQAERHRRAPGALIQNLK
jgi:hypothetical protein